MSRARIGQQFDRRPAIPTDGDAIPLGDEIVLDPHRQVLFVLNDQNVLFVGHRGQFNRFSVVLHASYVERNLFRCIVERNLFRCIVERSLFRCIAFFVQTE